MKAIILAAGKGTRLGKYTKNLPKCMLNFDGITLLQTQIDMLMSCDINNIVIVKGHISDKIKIKGVKYYINKDYENTNMVETLMCAEKSMDDDIIVCYGDILYEKRVLQKVLKDRADIGVAVDKDYWDYWKARFDNPEVDIESLVIKNGKIIELGTPNCKKDAARFRYVGLIKFSKNGVKILKRVYNENKKRYYNKDEPWMNSKSFKKAYMTCMLNAIIKTGYIIKPIIIKHGWLEFDTVDDYEKAIKWLKDGTLKRFYKSNI